MSFRISPNTFRRIGWAACFGLVFVCAFSLSGTLAPPLELDPSWHAVLEYAALHHLQFGTQIVFTFGPLGFLAARTGLGHLLGIRLAFAFFWGLLIALAATGMARRLPGWVRYAFLGWLVIFALSEGLDQTAYFVMAYGACLALADDPARRWQVPLFGLGVVLLSLIKFTFLSAGIFSLALVVLSWVAHRKVAQAITLLVAAPATFVAAWVALGQSPSHLVPWLRNGLELASGYSAAMNLVPKTSVLLGGLGALAAFAGAWIVTAWQTRRTFQTLAVLVTLAQYAFLAWKEGFTRSGDWHTFIFLWFIPLGLSLCFLVDGPLPGATSAQRAREALLAASFVCSLAAAHFQIPGFPLRQFVEWPRRAQHNASMFLAALSGKAPDLYAQTRIPEHPRMLTLDRAQSVIGGQSVDVMNYLALAAVINGMNYQPRPVFQGFVAYTQVLQNLNAAYFRGGERPRFVLLCQQATDGRFPALEDAAAFNFVLNNYVPVARDGPFLVLQQRTEQDPAWQLVHDQALHFGEKLDLTPWAHAPLFMSASIRPTFWGRAATFLYQQEPVSMRVSSGGGMKQYRLIPSMAELPFLLSPVLNSNYDVLNLYISHAGIDPESIVFDPSARAAIEFQDVITVRLYSAPGFPHAAAMTSPANIQADVQGRVFEPRPSSVQSSCGTQATTFQGAPAWRVCAPSKIVLDIPPNSAWFSGTLGVPEEAYLGKGDAEAVDITIDACSKPGQCQRRLERLLHPSIQHDDHGRISFRIAIEKLKERFLVLSTTSSPGDATLPGVSAWSQCRFEESPPQ